VSDLSKPESVRAPLRRPGRGPHVDPNPGRRAAPVRDVSAPSSIQASEGDLLHDVRAGARGGARRVRRDRDPARVGAGASRPWGPTRPGAVPPARDRRLGPGAAPDRGRPPRRSGPGPRRPGDAPVRRGGALERACRLGTRRGRSGHAGEHPHAALGGRGGLPAEPPAGRGSAPRVRPHGAAAAGRARVSLEVSDVVFGPEVDALLYRHVGGPPQAWGARAREPRRVAVRREDGARRARGG
jgi:hypothetical protein